MEKIIKKKINDFDCYYLNDNLADHNFIINQLKLSKTIYHLHYSRNLFKFENKILNLYKNSKLNIVNNNFTLNQLIKLGVDTKKFSI